MKFEIAPPNYIASLTLQEAQFYCKILVIDGRRDWRLPSDNELTVIKLKYPEIFGEHDVHTFWALEDLGDEYWDESTSKYHLIPIRDTPELNKSL